MFNKFFSIVIVLIIMPAWALSAESVSAADSNPRVALETSLGTITLELDQVNAPRTTANFIDYVRDGFYDGTIFHRVIPDFMIQGGGFTPDMKQKQTRSPIPNEADNGLENRRGTIAMARTSAPHSATAQFFINHKDNAFLNHRDKSPQGWGYCVFGRVIDGMDVVDAIAGKPTRTLGMYENVPVEPIVIKKAVLLEPEEKPAVKQQ
jgi:cyclophilin family peptidyl-prolyl cis-trans isomerase